MGLSKFKPIAVDAGLLALTLLLHRPAFAQVAEGSESARIAELRSKIERRSSEQDILELGRSGDQKQIGFLRSIREKICDAPPNRLSQQQDAGEEKEKGDEAEGRAGCGHG